MKLTRHTFDIVLDDGDDSPLDKVEEAMRTAIGGMVHDIEYIGASEPEDEDNAS